MVAKPNGSTTIERELIHAPSEPRPSSGRSEELDLPAPRIWKPAHLAEFLSVSTSWIYKRTETSAEDPIPRVAGVGRLRFDTSSPNFQSWMRRQLGDVDTVEVDE